MENKHQKQIELNLFFRAFHYIAQSFVKTFNGTQMARFYLDLHKHN